jgi:hypothetical protein
MLVLSLHHYTFCHIGFGAPGTLPLSMKYDYIGKRTFGGS